MASTIDSHYCYSCKGTFPNGTIILHNILTDKKVRFCAKECISKYTAILREAERLKLPDQGKWSEDAFQVSISNQHIFDFEGDDD